jgi:O-antigen/teichoic acid export membrane protein
MARSSSLKEGVGLTTVARIVNAACAAGVGIVVARLLGPSGAGAFAVSASIVFALTAVSNLGLGLGLNYFVAIDRWRSGDALRDAQPAALLLGTGSALLAAALFAGIGDVVVRGIPAAVVAVALAAVPLALSTFFSLQVVLGARRYRAYGVAIVLQGVVTLTLVVILGAGFGLLGAVAGVTGGHAIMAAGLLAWGRRHLPREAPGGDRDVLARLRETASFSWKPYLANALHFLNLRVDVFILNAVATSAILGQYAVAMSVNTAGVLVPGALATVVLPWVAAAGGRGRELDQRTASVRSMRHAVLIAAMMAGLLAGAVAAIPLVYGDAFREAITLGLILIPGTVAYGAGKVVASNILASGHPQYALYTAVLVTPPTVVLYLLLIPAMSATGAALVSTVSYISSSVLLLLFFRRATGIALRELIPRREEIEDWRRLVAALARRGLKPVVRAAS